jgi:hypothetical protein
MLVLAPLFAPEVPAHARDRGLAPSTQQYVNSTVGFAISYPSTWHMQKSAETDLYLTSPDNGIQLEVSSGKLHMLPRQIRDFQQRNLRRIGKVVGPISYSVKAINGFAFHLAEGAVTLKDGTATDVFWMDRNHKTSFFDLGAEIRLKAPHADTDTGQLGAIINSVIFFS